MAKGQVLEDAPIVAQSAVRRAEKREDTRSKIALYYVVGFLCVVIYAMILFAVKDMSINDLRDLLLALSGILSGPLGFIIGYYFKSQASEE